MGQQQRFHYFSIWTNDWVFGVWGGKADLRVIFLEPLRVWISLLALANFSRWLKVSTSFCYICLKDAHLACLALDMRWGHNVPNGASARRFSLVFVQSAVSHYLYHLATREAVLAVILWGHFSISLGALSLKERVCVGCLAHKTWNWTKPTFFVSSLPHPIETSSWAFCILDTFI